MSVKRIILTLIALGLFAAQVAHSGTLSGLGGEGESVPVLSLPDMAYEAHDIPAPAPRSEQRAQAHHCHFIAVPAQTASTFRRLRCTYVLQTLCNQCLTSVILALRPRPPAL